MAHTREVILLADSSKAGKVSFARAGQLEQLHTVITDTKLDPKFAKELTKKGIKVVRA